MVLLLAGAESMPRILHKQGHVLSPAPGWRGPAGSRQRTLICTHARSGSDRLPVSTAPLPHRPRRSAPLYILAMLLPCSRGFSCTSVGGTPMTDRLATQCHIVFEGSLNRTCGLTAEVSPRSWMLGFYGRR